MPSVHTARRRPRPTRLHPELIADGVVAGYLHTLSRQSRRTPQHRDGRATGSTTSTAAKPSLTASAARLRDHAACRTRA